MSVPPIPCQSLQDQLNATWPDLQWSVGLGGQTAYRLLVADRRGRRHFMLAPFAVVAHDDRTQRTPRALMMINAAVRSCIAKADAA